MVYSCMHVCVCVCAYVSACVDGQIDRNVCEYMHMRNLHIFGCD